MKIIGKSEGLNWIRDHKLPFKEEELKHFYKNSISHYLPVDSGMKTNLARGIAKMINEDNDGEGFFWIVEWGIWSNSENPNLFYAYRKSLNENREIVDAPFHVYKKSDLNDLECLLDLSLYFIWTVFLVSPSKKMIFMPNKDEYIDFCCEDEKMFEEYKGWSLIKKLRERKKDLFGNPV